MSPEPTGAGGASPSDPPSTASSGGRKKALIIGGIGVALLLTALGVVVSGVFGGDDAAADGEEEVFLSPASEVGPDPFSADPLAMPPDPALAQPVTTQEVTVDVSGSAAVVGNDGAKPGLYGGTMNVASCDPQQIVDFLAANPDKAQAWVDALNADPEVALEDGRPPTVALIPEYVAGLTPMVLTQDTRVTNHGFKDGRATKLQSTLQKGTAVLVDGEGVPRVKCYCGNPLLPPVASKTKPVYRGHRWEDFQPTQVTVVQRSTTIINVFVLTDITTAGLFSRPRGSTGTMDGPPPGGAATTTTTAPGTTAPPTTSGGGATTAPPTTSGGGATTAPPTTAGPTTAPPTTAAPTTPCGPPDASALFSVTVTNNSQETLEIFDDDPGCNTNQVATLSPGGVATVDTYVGHYVTASLPSGGFYGDLYVDGTNHDLTLT